MTLSNRKKKLNEQRKRVDRNEFIKSYVIHKRNAYGSREICQGQDLKIKEEHGSVRKNDS